MKKIHIYNTKGQKVCSKEYMQNKHNIVNFGFEDLAHIDINKMCKRCMYRIGKPYFSDELLFELSLKKTD